MPGNGAPLSSNQRLVSLLHRYQRWTVIIVLCLQDRTTGVGSYRLPISFSGPVSSCLDRGWGKREGGPGGLGRSPVDGRNEINARISTTVTVSSNLGPLKARFKMKLYIHCRPCLNGTHIINERWELSRLNWSQLKNDWQGEGRTK